MNINHTVIGTRHTTGHHQIILFGNHLDHFQFSNGYLFCTHMAWQLHQFKNSSRPGSLTDGTGGTMEVRTMTLWSTAFVVTLDDSLEAFSLGSSGHLNQLAHLKDIHFDFLAQFKLFWMINPKFYGLWARASCSLRSLWPLPLPLSKFSCLDTAHWSINS